MRLAICHILDRHNNVVKYEGKAVEVGRYIPDLPADELKKWAESEHLKFKEWWLK